jgi:4-hydroxythreonine-4-phosphate dehydrogenase
MGDPAGIGPEVVLKAVAEAEIRRVCVPVIIGDAQLLAHTARTLDLQCGYDIVRKGEPIPAQLSEPLIFHLDNINGFIEPGVESVRQAKRRVDTLKRQWNFALPEALMRLPPLRLTSDHFFSVATAFPVTQNSSLI